MRASTHVSIYTASRSYYVERAVRLSGANQVGLSARSAQTFVVGRNDGIAAPDIAIE